MLPNGTGFTVWREASVGALTNCDGEGNRTHSLNQAEAPGDVARVNNSRALLEDRPEVSRVLTASCHAVPVAGNQVHDVDVAATMLAHGKRRLLTFNQRDIRRYGDRTDPVSTVAGTGTWRTRPTGRSLRRFGAEQGSLRGAFSSPRVNLMDRGPRFVVLRRRMGRDLSMSIGFPRPV